MTSRNPRNKKTADNAIAIIAAMPHSNRTVLNMSRAYQRRFGGFSVASPVSRLGGTPFSTANLFYQQLSMPAPGSPRRRSSPPGQSLLREKMLNALTHPAETSSTTGRGGKSAKAIALSSPVTPPPSAAEPDPDRPPRASAPPQAAPRASPAPASINSKAPATPTKSA